MRHLRLFSIPLLAGLVVACASGPPAPVERAIPDLHPGGEERLAPLRAVAGELARREGLLATHLDTVRGRLLLELPAASGPGGALGEFLYVERLASGLGLAALPLDRGRSGSGRLLRFRRLGRTVIAEVPNLRFRTADGGEAARRAVEESFASAVLWGGEVLAEDAASGRILVDFTSFVVRDALGIAAALATAGAGAWSLDPARSGLRAEGCLSFPENLELEALLTFAGPAPPAGVIDGGRPGDGLAFVQRISLLRLPGPGYLPLAHDPRAGTLFVAHEELDAPLGAPTATRLAIRHRLAPPEPGDREPARPQIVYHVDRAIPEPLRSAVLEGAGWWAEAFSAAGLPGVFGVALLPEGVDPLDARYHVIQWVHRTTRGWSFGGGVVDPRTGERVKGHVLLDALRARHDRLLFEALLGAEELGRGGASDPVEISLARLRQLAAHEVGHALGLAHNFAGSASGRASVMDYPAPFVRVTEGGGLDLSRAYADGVGAWDRAALRRLYGGEGEDPGVAPDPELLFLSDEDARPAGSGHPRASLWDNGADPVTELERTRTIRRLALARFGERNLPEGTPLAELEERLAPLYFFHRFQIAAAAKVVGGVEYRHALRGDGAARLRRARADEQRRAISALLAALAPAELDLPEALLQRLPPRPPGYPEHGELFRHATRPAFDALGAAASLADLTLAALLEPARAARLVDFHRRSPELPGLEELLTRTVEAIFADVSALEPRLVELAWVVQRAAVDRLLSLAGDPAATPSVRARVESTLADLLQRLDALEPLDAGERAHLAFLTSQLGRHLARPAPAAPTHGTLVPAPPGDPIGAWADGAPEADCAIDP